MNDLISRAHVLAEYDQQHKGLPGGARKIMEDAPAVDAIPVEWLKAQISPFRDKLKDEAKGVFNATVREIIYRW